MNSPFIAHSLKKVVHYKNNLAMHCTNGNKFGVPHVRAETHSLFPSWVNLCCTFSHADSCIRITISCPILSLRRRMNGEMFYERNVMIIGPILTTLCMYTWNVVRLQSHCAVSAGSLDAPMMMARHLIIKFLF